MRGHHARAGGGGDLQIGRIGEPADVVADHGAGGEGRLGHRSAPGIDRERKVEPLAQGRHGGHHALQLLGHTDLGSGTRLHPADVEDVCPLA